MTWRSAEDHARETGPLMRFMKGMIRRVLVTISTNTTKWQVRGVHNSVGGDEVFEAELFPGVGIFARGSSSTEAVVLNVGGSKVPVIVATRDEATRRKIASQVGPGEAALYNDSLICILKQGGAIELRTHAGTALAVPTMADFNALRDFVRAQFSASTGHTHALVSGGIITTTIITKPSPQATPPTPADVAAAVGTTKTKLE